MIRPRMAVLAGAIAVLATALAMPSAHAVGSLGASQNCDSDGHCVVGNAGSANSNTGMTGVGAAFDLAAAYCTGKGTGATLIEITCSIGNKSETMSFPGSAGAVPVTANSWTFERLPVCWSVTGYFPTVNGGPHEVTTGGCAMVAV